MRYNIDKYIEVDSCHTTTNKVGYPSVQWDIEKRECITDDALYGRVKKAILTICEENSEAYEQLFVAFKFYHWEAYEYNQYIAPPVNHKGEYKNVIPELAKIYRKGKEALTALNGKYKNIAKVRIDTSQGRITHIGVITPTKTYAVPEFYFNLADFDAGCKQLTHIYNNISMVSEQDEIKEWLRCVLDWEDTIKGDIQRNNYEQRFFTRLGGLYRWLNDNGIIASSPRANQRDATIDFIKSLFNLQYADNAKIVQYITHEKGIISKK